jgi:CRISPR/Cas system-associated exonuclease Cas4 (RecB family)
VTKPIKLSPSDLTFLWDECKRCFYLKYVHGITRPAMAFPSIFGAIDRLMKDYYESRSTAELDASLPAGKVRFGERWVESLPVTLSAHTGQCYIRGKFDSILAFEDGSFGVVDFKTSEPRASHIAFYGRQLHAYAYALENPAPGKFNLSPITRLGLLVVQPKAMDVTASGQIAYLGGVSWLEVRRDDAGFMGFLDEVLCLLEQPEPPEAGEKCGFCAYREHARQHGM